MTTKKIIEQMEKEFDERFLAFRDPDIVDGFAKDQIKSFIHSYTRKLIQAVAEEIIGENETLTVVGRKYGTDTGEIKEFIGDGEEEWKLPRNDLRIEQRLKEKEILEVIK